MSAPFVFDVYQYSINCLSIMKPLFEVKGVNPLSYAFTLASTPPPRSPRDQIPDPIPIPISCLVSGV